MLWLKLGTTSRFTIPCALLRPMALGRSRDGRLILPAGISVPFVTKAAAPFRCLLMELASLSLRFGIQARTLEPAHFVDYDSVPGRKVWSWGPDADALEWRKALPDDDSARFAARDRLPRSCLHLMAAAGPPQLGSALKESDSMAESNTFAGLCMYNSAMLNRALGRDAEAERGFRNSLLLPDCLLSYHLTGEALASNEGFSRPLDQTSG